MTAIQTSPLDQTLTADDVKALRQAESISFHLHDGQAYVQAALTDLIGARDSHYSAAQQRIFPLTDLGDRSRRIQVAGRAYLPGSPVGEDRDWTCFASIYSARFVPTWTTLTSLLRKGDELRLAFWGDRYNNLVVDDARLHADSLQVEVIRGDQKMTFSVITSITPANTARMIRRRVS